MLQEITNIFHRPRSKIAERVLQHAKRSNDAIIILRQDNFTRSVKIEALNLLAIRLLGYENEDVVEHNLSLILPDNIAEAVTENLEFAEDGNNIDVILNKVANFKIKTKFNVEIPVNIKIIRSLSSTHVARFQLVMNDSSLMQSLAANRAAYRTNMHEDEIFDKKTSLLTKESILKDMELIASSRERSVKESCFVIYKFADYANLRTEHGADGAFNMLRGLIKTIETTKRANDFVGLIGSGTVIVILPETAEENIKTAINRIYGRLTQEVRNELNVCYDIINFGTSVELQLDNALNSKAGIF